VYERGSERRDPARATAWVLRRRRLRAVTAAGLVDSLGLSVGWTLFNLYAVHTQGLTAVGTYNAALFTGVALSAPATGWLSSRLGGRRLLRSTAALEAALRVASFVLLIEGAPVGIVALCITAVGMTAWTGYAGMRAEIAAADRRAGALAWYLGAIASIEGIGAAAAALLPLSLAALRSPGALAAVLVVYAGVLIPTVVVAGSSEVERAVERVSLRSMTRHARAIAGGFAVMFLASGPVFLAVGLAAELHGRTAVAYAALAFLAGSLLAPRLATLLERRRLPSPFLWPALGALVAGGWIAAPWSVGGLVLAQFVAGLALPALEGTIDASVAGRESGGRVTAGLAWGAAARAIGTAAAVSVAPALFDAGGVTLVCIGMSASCVAAACVGGLGAVRRRARRGTIRERLERVLYDHDPTDPGASRSPAIPLAALTLSGPPS
jgi:hypothetical protein